MYKIINGSSTKFNFELKQPWSKRYYTKEFSSDSYGDGKSHPVSTCKFSNGKSAVVFYDEYSYIVFDENGRYFDGNACHSTRDAKREATAVAFGEYEEYQDSKVNSSASINASKSLDLTDQNTQWEVADWISDYIRDEIYKKYNRRRTKNPREVWLDDVSINSEKFHCQVWLDDGSDFGKHYDDFNCRLNFYDAKSKDMDDIKYLVDEELREFLYYLK